MKITLIGMNDYMTDAEDDLFQNLNFDGVNKNNLTNNILMVCGEFPVLWANPYFVKNMIGVWCEKMKPTINKWVNAFAIEYDPLYNFDRTEEYSDVTTHGKRDTRTVTNDSTDTTYTHSGTLNGQNSNTTTNSVTAYNSNTFAPSDKNEGSATDTTITSTNDRTIATRNGTTSDAESGTTKIDHTGRLYGNIGTVTSQEMLIAELNLAENYNIYDMITDAFKHDFCIMTY